MKRLLLAAVAGLCSVGAARAQDGYLAPTAPVVPAPVLKNGNLLTPAGGTGSWGAAGGVRPFAMNNWSPLRNPAMASVGAPAGAPSGYGYAVPPLPAGVGGADGLCGQAGCATPRASGSCLDKLKAWMCYHPSKTELPKLRPTPYQTPLQGMFPCASGSTGCAPGCATPVYGQPIYGQPLMQPVPQPMPIPPAAGAGAVTMPPRGSQGTAAVPPTWQGRTTPAPAQPGIAGARYASPVVPAGAKVPQK